MRFIFQQTRLAIVGVFVAGIIVGLLLTPVKRMSIISVFQSEYGDYLYACDSAMRSHLFAKLSVDKSPSLKTVDNLEAAELGLLSCQDYDLFQKKLLRYGLKEEDLSFMRLEALEERGKDLQEVVSEHEFRY